MAQKITETRTWKDALGSVDAALKAGRDPEAEATFQVAVRLSGTDQPRKAGMTVRWERFLIDENNNWHLDTTDEVVVKGKFQKPIPPDDIVDPETDTVLYTKGSVREGIPKLSKFKEGALPNGLKVDLAAAETRGDLISAYKKMLYQWLVNRHPSWAAGQEIATPDGEPEEDGGDGDED